MRFSISDLLFSLLLLAGIVHPSFAQQSDEETMDQIVAVVNDHVILKSDVDNQVRDYMMQQQQQTQQQPSFSEDLWYSVLQNMVDRYVVLDKAREDSIEVSDAQVDQAIDQQINQYIQQVGSEEALEEELGQSIVQIRSDLREDYREEMVVSQAQQQKRQEISITRSEVREFFEEIPEDSLPTIPEQVAVSQIVALPDPEEDARVKARKFADQLRDSLVNHDKSLEELARRHSDGPSAEDGGGLGMMPVDDLVGEYSAAASALEEGEISEVVETSFGFHIIRLNERSGDNIDTNHILIEIDDENYDDQAARDRLTALRDSVLNHDKDFADLAREHSEDPNSAPRGGRIVDPETGDRYLEFDNLDSSLYRIVLLLDEEGDISEPRRFNIGEEDNEQRAFRIVRLDEHIEEHRANLEQDYNEIRNYALQQKQFEEIQKWISELKQDFYVEYKIPVPVQFEQEQRMQMQQQQQQTQQPPQGNQQQQQQQQQQQDQQ